MTTTTSRNAPASTTWLPRWLQPALVIALLLATDPSATVVLAEDATLAAQESRAVQALATQLGERPARIDALLSDLGFPPPEFRTGAAAGYDRWPTLRKLEAAYHGAAAISDSEAHEFLRVFSRNLASQHSNALRYETSLREYFADVGDGPVQPETRRFEFAREYVQPTEPPGPGLRSVLLTLERYASRMPGGVQSLVAACCGLSQVQIYRTLVTSETNAQAMLRALQGSAIPPALREKIHRMLVHTADRVYAFRHDAAFEPFLESGPTRHVAARASGVGPAPVPRDAPRSMDDAAFEQAIEELAAWVAESETSTVRQKVAAAEMPAGTMPPLPGHVADASASGAHLLPGLGGAADLPSGGGGGGSPNATRYANVYHTIGGGGAPAGSGGGGLSRGGGSGGGGGMSFTRMSRSARGFGGVVFGNQVTNEVDRELFRVAWVPEPEDLSQRPVGRLHFVFADGTVGYSAALPDDLVHVAYMFVYEGFGEDWPLVDPESGGVGLAGVYELDDNDTDITALPVLFADGSAGYERVTPFVVHPGIDGLPLGYAAVQADALSFAARIDYVVERMRDAGASEAERHAAEAWLDSARGFFKITDAPLTIQRQADGYVDVLRSHVEEYDVLVRTVALLSTQTFDSDEPEDESSTPLYPAVPGLVSAFAAFKDLNDFAEAFALVRWARMQGAAWDSRPRIPPRGASATRILKTEDGGVRLITEANLASSILAFIADVETRATAISDDAREATEALRVTRSLSELRRERAAAALALERLQAGEAGITQPLQASFSTRMDHLRERERELARSVATLREGAVEAFVERHTRRSLEEIEYDTASLYRERLHLADEFAAFSYDAFNPEDLSTDARARYEELRSAADAALTEYWNAPLDSEEESRAEKRLEALRDRISGMWPEDARLQAEFGSRTAALNERASALRQAKKQLLEDPALAAWLDWERLQDRVDEVLDSVF